jgi:hypothetical protein
MLQIINLAIDGEITTKEQAAALVEAEATEAAAFYSMSREEARCKLLDNIGYVTGYLSHKAADHIMELFDTQHPVFGRQHPSAEEAFRMGQEYAQKRIAPKEND